MTQHIDEILNRALSTDEDIVPRFNLRLPDGTLIGQNVSFELVNQIVQEGTPVNKATLDELLAASGVTSGTASALTLLQSGYVLEDSATVRFRLHTASGANPTLNVNSTGAKPLCGVNGLAMESHPAGMWITAIYSEAVDAYIAAVGMSPAQVSKLNFETGGFTKYNITMANFSEKEYKFPLTRKKYIAYIHSIYPTYESTYTLEEKTNAKTMVIGGTSPAAMMTVGGTFLSEMPDDTLMCSGVSSTYPGNVYLYVYLRAKSDGLYISIDEHEDQFVTLSSLSATIYVMEL